MINKKTKGLIKETDGGLGCEFFPRGATIWIPATFFVLLVLFQMMPLPAGVLKVVSPATYELYEEMLPEVGKGQRSEVRDRKGKSKRLKMIRRLPQYDLPDLRGRRRLTQMME